MIVVVFLHDSSLGTLSFSAGALRVYPWCSLCCSCYLGLDDGMVGPLRFWFSGEVGYPEALGGRAGWGRRMISREGDI